MNTQITLPKLPQLSYLGEDSNYGYDAEDMITYAAEAVKNDRAARVDVDERVVFSEKDGKLRFHIGVQSFTLDSEIEDSEHKEFMQRMLLKALASLQK